MSRIPNPSIDYTSKDYEAFRELMIEKLKEKMPEYTDTSETDAGIVILEALANGLDILSLYADVIANDVLLPTTQDRTMATIISKCLGYTPYNQTASEYEQVFVLDEINEQDVIIPKGTVVKTKESSDLETIYYETMEDFVIPSGALGNEQDEDGNYLYTVTIKEGTSVNQDVIGTSSGAPIQSFKLNYTSVLEDSIELYINEGSGQQLWKRVDSFVEYNETSKVYTTSIDEFDVCTIEFGNGLKGKIPEAYPNGIIANYRIGGGEAGNVNANIITELETDIAHIESTFNLSATVLGHEKESLESIKENAPASFRSRGRLVTLEDYEDLLRINFYDFLHLFATLESTNKLQVTIYYMLKSGYTLTDRLLTSIAEFIAERSMIGTTYELKEYTPQEVDIVAKMYVDKDYDKDEIIEDIKLNSFKESCMNCTNGDNLYRTFSFFLTANYN